MKLAYLKLAPPRPSCPHQLYAMQVCSENKNLLSNSTVAGKQYQSVIQTCRASAWLAQMVVLTNPLE